MPARTDVRAMALAFGAFALALACIVFTRDHGRVAAIWPGNALAVAVLLNQPRRTWALYAAAALAGCFAANVAVGDGPATGLVLAACNGAEILVCATLVRRLIGETLDVTRPRDLLLFCAVAGLAPIGPGLAATAVLANDASGLKTFLDWYLADALGLVIITPAFLALAQDWRALRAQITERRSLGPVLAVATCLIIAFGQTSYPLLFLTLPPLVWCAFTLSVSATALALIVTTMVAVVATLTGYGPCALIAGSLAVKLAVLQVLLAAMTLVTLPLTAVIQERRRLTASLRETLARAEVDQKSLRLASQIARLGHWRIAAATRQTVWSDEMFALHGVTRASFYNRKGEFKDFYSQEDRTLMASTVSDAFATGQPFDIKVRLRRADEDTPRMIRYQGEAERDVTGAVVAIFGVMQDITEEEAMLQRVAESEARHRLLAEHSSDVILQVGTDGVIQYVSPSVSRYGYEPLQLIGSRTPDLVHPDDVDKVRALNMELFLGGDVDPKRDRNYRVRTQGGDYVWMEGNPGLVRNAVGQVTAVISQLRDVSERVASMNALAESEMRYRVIAEKATDVISRTKADGRLVYLSPSILDVTGHSVEEMIGKSLLWFLHPDDVEPTLSAYQAIIAGTRAEAQPITYRARHKDGHWLWLEGNPTPIRDASGMVVEFIDVTRDVGARKQLEADLLAARDAAEAAAMVKADFMANMSHEIRTPLTAILGFTSLLGVRADLPEEAQSQVRRVGSAGQALLAIVNDILDFSKLEAGSMPILPKPVSPVELLSDAVALFEPQAGAKALKLVFEPADNLPAHVSLDPDRVRQVLLNLIGNGVKFTDAGSVTLTATHDAGQLRVAVRDSGAGMDAQQQGKLFQRFSQVDASSTRRHGGTGLGLAICQGLVQAMGGTIDVTSTVGEGSTFAFAIPAPACAAPDAARTMAQPKGIEGLRILLADDNALNRDIAKSILAPFEVEVTDVCDGAEAVDMARSLPFDIIMLDIRMPVMDGPEAALRIRAEAGPNQDVPILAFSADYDLGRLGDAAAGAFDGLVRKPLEVGALLSALAEAVHWRLEPADQTGQPSTQALHRA